MSITQEQLERFFKVLSIDKTGLGLIKTDGNPAELQVPKIEGGMVVVNMDAKTFTNDVLVTIGDCAKRGRWCRINMMDGTLDKRIYAQFKNIGESGVIDIRHITSKDKTYDMRWPAESKILLVINRADIPNIPFDDLYQIIGPVLD